MNSFAIAFKDIRQVLRDWKSALFLVIMPIVFTTFFGLVLNPVIGSDVQADTRLPVGWINEDGGGLVSSRLADLLAASDVIRPVALEQTALEQASQQVAGGELAALVRVPAGYSERVLAGQAASLEVIADQTSQAGRTAITAMEGSTGRLLGAVETARLSVEVHADPARLQPAFEQAIAAWQTPPLGVQAAQTNPGDGAPALQVTGFTQSSAGMMVQFAVFGLINSAMLLVLERKTRCLQRMLTAPVRRAEIIGGHFLAMFLLVFFQMALLVLLGQLLFGVPYLREPLAVLLMMLVLALWSASLGLLIGALAQREDQVIVLSLVAMFIFSALGGAWFPLEIAGKTFSAIGHVLPSAWAMDGFQNIVMRGLGFGSVLLPAGIVLGYALVFFGLALWRFRTE